MNDNPNRSADLRDVQALVAEQLSDVQAIAHALQGLPMPLIRLTAALGVLLTARIERLSTDGADCLENLNALLGPTIKQWAAGDVGATVSVR